MTLVMSPPSSLSQGCRHRLGAAGCVGEDGQHTSFMQVLGTSSIYFVQS